jgi:hypothetical protein
METESADGQDFPQYVSFTFSSLKKYFSSKMANCEKLQKNRLVRGK